MEGHRIDVESMSTAPASLRDIVAAQTVMAEELPLVHTTRCQEFREVLASGQLQANEACKVFGGFLLYFFYGRPAYQTKLGDVPTGSKEVCPVCFVFKTGTWSSGARRLSSCDTGALCHHIFEDHLFWADQPGLELYSVIESARKLVPLVFRTNTDYFFGRAVSPAPASFEAGSVALRYHHLLTDAAHPKADDRRSAIEIQMDSPIPVADRLLYVVLPRDLLNEAAVLAKIQTDWGASPLAYNLYLGRRPNDYRNAISDLVEAELRKGGLL